MSPRTPKYAQDNCQACWHLWSLHGPEGCQGKEYPAHSLTGEPCSCTHEIPVVEEIAEAIATIVALDLMNWQQAIQFVIETEYLEAK
jgi:hypothetical protein